MDYQHKFVDQISFRIFFGLLAFSGTLLGVSYLVREVLNLDGTIVYIVLAFVVLIIGLIITLILAKQIAEPMRLLKQMLLYKYRPEVSDSEPTTKGLKIGKELVEALWNLIKDNPPLNSSTGPVNGITNVAGPVGSAPISPSNVLMTHVLENSPLPIISVGPDQKINYINKSATDYFGINNDVNGQALFDVINLMFPSDDTYEVWLKGAQTSKVSDKHIWFRVRAKVGEQQAFKQFDLGAYFTKDSPSGVETILALFDQTEHYSQDDHDVGFLALAVHELRTPLTIMRGYIEVFEDELGPTLSPELKVFMEKLNAAAQQLTAFVSNILNMSRVEENQLTLSLREEDWQPLLESAISDLKLRAQVHGKTIELTIDPAIPKVAVDSISIREVLNNLIENAVKYGGQSNQILVRSGLSKDGQIETTVQDFGVGIPSSILPHLFEKFYRSHRSKGTASGTGLGLYLCHAIIKAHGGQIGAESYEGKGSTFRFTLLPYSAVASQADPNSQDGIIRGAHGWIKNHNIYKQ
ncbi:MAG: PAS domain-containing sensor histidine kinase [bacterium]|nr:PAS domain-containing sensor histidine kinase [bacterium]